jgi:hypothetical protein
MKRVIVIFIAFCAISSAAIAQRWTVTGGILGALNFTQFNVSGDNPSNFSYKTGTAGAGGIWVNFPLGRVVSIEPEFIFSTYKYIPTYSTTNLSLIDGNINYFTIPLLFKFNLGSAFALTAGPELDFITSIKSNNFLMQKSDFTSTSVSINAGFEIFPHGRATIFGRYIGGLTDMNNVKTSTDPETLKNQNFQLGLKIRLFGHKIVPPAAPVAVVAPPPPAPPVDTDGDGIPDNRDKCPTVPGVAKYEGCPIPDTDGDGINDELDKCPTVPGVAKYNGCPIPDTDGDGINDEEDKCPKTPGIASNYGCPEMIFHYMRDDADLSADDKANLDRVVTFMNNNPSVHIIIEGYTSNTGTAAYNLKLSQKRADNSLQYLVSKGISADRMKTIGYGLQYPVGDNTTKEGRAANRRVVMKIDKL